MLVLKNLIKQLQEYKLYCWRQFIEFVLILLLPFFFFYLPIDQCVRW